MSTALTDAKRIETQRRTAQEHFDEQEPDMLIVQRAYRDNHGLIKQCRGESVPKLGLLESGRR